MQNILSIRNKQTFSKEGVTDPFSKALNSISSLPGLIAYYPLDETSGNAINRAPSTLGTLNGTVSNVTQGVAGLVGRSYSFDGAGDRVIITGIVPAATFSFSFLFKRNGAPDANDRVIDQASGGPTKGWELSLDTNGALALKTWNDSGLQINLDYGILQDNTWYLVGGSIGPSSSKIYLNGEEVGSGGGNTFGAGITADLQFGCRSGGVNNATKGYLQHIAIASGVLWSDHIHSDISNLFF